MLHADVLELLYPRSWLMRSHRYCVDRGPCSPTDAMVRTTTGSTVTRHAHEGRSEQVAGASGDPVVP